MTAIEIVNMAISACGSPRIGDFTDDSSEARIAKDHYAILRDAVLEAREWSCAKRRLLLAKDAVSPAFGYTFQYVLPSTVLRVVRVYDTSGLDTGVPLPDDDWVKEGARVLTNTDSPIYAEVLVRADEGEFSPGLVLTLVHRLTAAFAVPMTENRVLAKDAMDLYKAQIIDGGASDGMQGRTKALRPPPLPGRSQHF
jgi:hypothetical protein